MEQCCFPKGHFDWCKCYPIKACKGKGILNDKSISLIVHENILNLKLLTIYNI